MNNSANYFLLDVFTNSRYGGNQMAIFPDGQFVPESLMPKIARELQLSETVFIFPPEDDENDFRMRVFTPEQELFTAGHPIIGASFYMTRHIDFDFEKKSIFLSVEQELGKVKTSVSLDRGSPVFCNMLQPLPEFGNVFEDKFEFAELLGLQEEELSDLPIEVISCGVPYTIIPVKKLDSIKKINLNRAVWNSLKEIYGVGLLYAFTTETIYETSHVHGRMFAPDAGNMEDAAHGSASGPLGCYFFKHRVLGIDARKLEIISEQGFELGRASLIYITVIGNASGIEEVSVGGECVFVGQGQIFLH